jgi:hypothetical protein
MFVLFGLHKGKAKVKSKAKSARRARLRQGDVLRVIVFFGLAIAGLAVSIPHLASEVKLLTGSSTLSAWLIALVVDMGMCAVKAHISAEGPAKRVAWTVLGSCTVLSIVLNSHAFYAHSVGIFGQTMAIVWGAFLPLFVLALSFMASEILLGKKE